MLENPVKPVAKKIIDIFPETQWEWTFRLENDFPVQHGQFMQLSVPMIGEAPISVSGFGEGYADFTIRKVGKVTDQLFNKKKGDTIFVRGSYGKGWPWERLKGKHVVIVAGGTGVSPVRSLINDLYDNPDYAKGVYLIIGYKNSNSILFNEELEKWKTAEHFHVVCTLDHEDYAGWKKGLVTECIQDIPFTSFDEQYESLVVGPPIMMKFAGETLLAHGVPEEKIWMSFERKMSCAVGKCGHCRIDETYVCLDGPVFNYTKAKTLID